MSERQRRPRPVRKAVLIVCEGKETEPCYFAQLTKTLGLGATVDLVIDGNTGYTDPVGLVNVAQKRIKKRKSEAKGSTTLTEFEEVWVVFDVEHASNGRWPQIAPAVVSALAKQILPAISRPSFEVWYVLHDRTTPPGLSCSNDAKPFLTACIGVAYGKERGTAQASAAWAVPRTAIALRNAARQDVFQGPNEATSAHVPVVGRHRSSSPRAEPGQHVQRRSRKALTRLPVAKRSRFNRRVRRRARSRLRGPPAQCGADWR